MAIIYSYPLIDAVSAGDIMLISDASKKKKTKSVTIEQLSDYFGTGAGGADNYVNGGSYSSGTLTLTRTGTLPDIGISGFFNGQYSSLTGAPTLATVATTGSYNDLSDQPTIPAAYTNADVDAHLNTGVAAASQILYWTGNDYGWVAQSGVGTDNYVDGGSISGDTLTLTRTGGLGDVDITGLLQIGTTSTTALAGNTTTITPTQANEIAANTLKTSFPGFGTTAGTALEGNTPVIEGTTTSQTAITEIKTLTSAEYAAITPAADVMYVIV